MQVPIEIPELTPASTLGDAGDTDEEERFDKYPYDQPLDFERHPSVRYEPDRFDDVSDEEWYQELMLDSMKGG